jgi:hypothetical protein
MRFLVQMLIVTGLAGLLAWGTAALSGATPAPTVAFLAGAVLPHPLYVLAVLILIFINGRTVLYRLDDKDD